MAGASEVMIRRNGQVMPWQSDTLGRQGVAATNTTSAILLAFGVNAALAAASCAAYVATGSSALLSLAAHTLIVASSHALLMFGIRSARRTPQLAQPPRAASDLHFWSYVAPLLLLSTGAGLSLFAGVDRLHDPHPIVEPDTAYAVLGVSAIVTGLSIWSAVAAYNARGLQLRSFAALRTANEPALFSALVQVFSVLTSTALAFAGVFVSHRFTIAEADGLAAIAIGLTMAAAAALLSLEIRALIARQPVEAATPRRNDAALGDGEARANSVRADDRVASTTAAEDHARTAPTASAASTASAATTASAPGLTSPSPRQHKKSKRSGR